MNRIKLLPRIRGTVLLALPLVLISNVVSNPVLAITHSNNLNAVILNTPYYDPGANSCSGSGGGAIGTGTLPNIVPDPYNSAFTQGANKFNVAPALIAALFTEENFTGIDPSQIAARWASFPKQHPDPNSGWPTNKYHTMGAFQFIPDTWASEGVDGDGDGVKDAQNIWDGAAGAANYVSSNGATVDKPTSAWHDAIFSYNHAEWYVDAVMVYYNFYMTGNTSTTVPTPTSTGGCGNAYIPGNCQVSQPVYMKEYSQAQLTQIFGDPGTSTTHPNLKLVGVQAWGFSTQASPLVAPCLDATVEQIEAQNINYKVTQFGCYRFDSDNGVTNIGLKSYHTYGAACDLNWDTNPIVTGEGVTAPHDMPQAYIDAFYDHGFTWGGTWTSKKDYMHFEWHGIVPQ